MTSEEVIKNIPIQLKKAIEYRKYTVERLSEETNIKLRRINSILNGKEAPEIFEIATFSACLDVSCDYLCSFSNEIKRNSSIIMRDVINMNMPEESIDVLRRIISIYMFLDDKARQELLNFLIK